jgi:Flp pilus assembly protein TadD
MRQQAIEDYNQAVRLRPDYAEAYNNRGVAYYFQGNVDLACRDLQRACDLGYCRILEEVQHRGSCR